MEEKFVKMFIKKQYQERLLFELNSKKREKAIDRFSHEAKKLLKENLILTQSEKIRQDDIEKFLSIKKNCKDVYIITLNSLYDKKFIKLELAITIFFDEYLPMIIVGETFALIKQEASWNTSMKFVLSAT